MCYSIWQVLRNRGGIMFKIKLDNKAVSNIVNIYFVLFLWVCLIGMMFQSSNEFVFVSFLVFSLVYFAIQVIKFLLGFKLLAVKDKKMPKKQKKALEKKYSDIYLVAKKMADYFTIFIFGLSIIYIFLFIQNISPMLLLLMMVILFVWIVYLIIYNMKTGK